MDSADALIQSNLTKINDNMPLVYDRSLAFFTSGQNKVLTPVGRHDQASHARWFPSWCHSWTRRGCQCVSCSNVRLFSALRFGSSVKRLCAGVGGGRSRASCSVSGLWELSCSLRHCSKSGQLTPAAQSYWSIELETALLSVLKTINSVSETWVHNQGCVLFNHCHLVLVHVGRWTMTAFGSVTCLSLHWKTKIWPIQKHLNSLVKKRPVVMCILLHVYYIYKSVN